MPIELSSLTLLRHSSPHSLLRITAAPKLLHQQQARSNTSKAEKARLPRDDEIKSWSVVLVDDDGRLTEPGSTKHILSSIDRKTQSLVVVSAGEPGSPPICKIINKQHMRDFEKAKALAARKSAVTTKTIELNWAIDGNDLAHRLQRVIDFLEKGNRVEIMMAAKRKGRKATEEEAQALVDKVRAAIGQCEGAKESRAMEGKLLGTATIHAEGRRKKGSDSRGEETVEAGSS